MTYLLIANIIVLLAFALSERRYRLPAPSLLRPDESPPAPKIESPYRAPWPASEEAEVHGYDIGMWKREQTAAPSLSASAIGQACSIDRIAALQAEVLVLRTIVDNQHQQLLEHQAAMAESQKIGGE